MGSLLPHDLQRFYPFEDRFLRLRNSPHRLHYVDEGSGPLTIFLHDIPLWSFYFRHLIGQLRTSFRCLAPDYLGFGLSDKPQDYDYSLRTLADNILDFLTQLQVGKFNLILHGNGGTPGMIIAERWPERVNRIVLLNANCFPIENLSPTNLCYRTPIFGPILLQGLNFAVVRSIFSIETGGLSRRGYRFPYSSWDNRIGIRQFMQNFGSDEDNAFLETIVQKLYILSHKKVLALWGMKDSEFGEKTLLKWKDEFDGLKIHRFRGSARDLLEKDFDTVLPLIRSFLVGGIEIKIPQL